jgi:uncharacterized protein YkwD
MLISIVGSVPHTDARATYLDSMENSLYVSINHARYDAGLDRLGLGADLVDIARYRSADMARRGYFSHTTPEGATFFTMLGRRGIPYRWAGEVLDRNTYPAYTMSDEAFAAYMDSPQHRAVIMDARYSLVGVGYALGQGGMNYFTVILVQP